MFLHFLKKVFLIFRETERSYTFSKKNFIVFWKIELSSPKPKNILIFQEGIFQARKINKATQKQFLVLWEMKVSNESLKHRYFFLKRVSSKRLKTKISWILG